LCKPCSVKTEPGKSGGNAIVQAVSALYVCSRSSLIRKHFKIQHPEKPITNPIPDKPVSKRFYPKSVKTVVLIHYPKNLTDPDSFENLKSRL
jgi:hypothetical protein